MCSNYRCPVDPCCPFLLFVVLYNYTRSVSRQIEWASLSLWLCAMLTDRWASQLIPPLVFVELWNVCCWWTRPSVALLFAWWRLCSSPGDGSSIPQCSMWSESLSTESIGFSCSPCLLLPHRIVQSFPVHHNGKSGCVNKSNNQWAQGSRQDRVPGRNMGLKSQVLCLERPQDGRSLEITRSLLENRNGKRCIFFRGNASPPEKTSL